MTKTITTPLASKETGAKNRMSLLTFKEAIFNDMSAEDSSKLLDKIFYDLLGSPVSEDTMYRNELLVFYKTIKKMILGIRLDINPNDIHVLEMCIE